MLTTRTSLRGLDLNLLVILDVLLNERNTTRAGERLYLSQSATSGALGRLRKFFDDPLLVRSGQRMVLTPLAEALVEPVRELLRQSEAIVNYRSAFSPQNSSRTFRINIADAVSTVLMTKSLERIRQEAPGVSIEIHSYVGSCTAEMARELADYMEQGHLDFLVAPHFYLSPHQPSEKLLEDRYVCVVWSGNKQIQKAISLEQYLSSEHVVTRFGMHRPEQINAESCALEESLQKAGYQRRIAVIVPSFSLKLPFLIGTNLVATMQESLALYYSKYLPLKILPLPIAIPPFEKHLQWHASLENDEGARWFRNILKETANATFPLNANNHQDAEPRQAQALKFPASESIANQRNRARREPMGPEVAWPNPRHRHRGPSELQS